MATSAWMKMMDRHDAERSGAWGTERQRWPWIGLRVGPGVFLGIPIPYRGYPGTNGEPR